jgi:NitT/TauT family transport system substrate-binding protein
MGVASTLESGLIAKYILGDESANAYAAGCALTTEFINTRPDVAKRYAAAWAKAIDFINKNPGEARKHLAKNTFTPDDVVDQVPMLGYIMTKDMNAKQMADFQKFADFGVTIGVVPEKIDVTKAIKAF